MKLVLSELIYNWEINGNVDQGQSGRGKNILKIEGDIIPRPINVTVTVSAINSPLKSKKIIDVIPTTPQVLLYENNPIHGIVFEQALFGNFSLDRPEIEVSAIPYFYSTNRRSSVDLIYEWLVNGKNVNSTPELSDIVFNKIKKKYI